MYPPSCVVTVIAALPNPTAVIVPLLSTVATFVSLEFQTTDLSIASSGDIVGIKVLVSPTSIDTEVSFNETPVTWITPPQLVETAAIDPIAEIPNVGISKVLIISNFSRIYIL